MSEPFLGEIRMVGWNFAANGWALCNGQLLSISQYSALFSLLGTAYGGDGITPLPCPTFKVGSPFIREAGWDLVRIRSANRQAAKTLRYSLTRCRCTTILWE